MPKTWLVLLIALFTWALSAVVATLPLTEVFRSHAPDTVLLAENPFLEQSKVDLTTGKRFLLQSLVFYPSQDPQVLAALAEQVENSKTWDALLHIYDSLPEQKQELQIAERYG